MKNDIAIVKLTLASGLAVGMVFLGPAAAPAGAHDQDNIPCTEAALRAALAHIQADGGGQITFSCFNTTIDIVDRLTYTGNNLDLDGETRNITMRYAGPDPCSQTEGQTPFLDITGNNNTVQHLTVSGFPEGIRFRGGDGNELDAVRFPVICEDALTNSVAPDGPATNTLVRDSYFEGAGDKAIQINSGTITIQDSEFVGNQKPMRAPNTTGRVIVRRNIIRGLAPDGQRPTGPHFSGGVIVWFLGNTVTDSTNGILVQENVQALILDNTISNGGYGVRVSGSGRVRLQGNTIHGNDINSVLIEGVAQADLGGGSVMIDGNSNPSSGNNSIKNVPSDNDDVKNRTSTLVKAENNWWDHTTVAEVQQFDVTALVDVSPLHP